MKARLLSSVAMLTLVGAMLSPALTLATTSAKVANNVAPWLSQAKLLRHASPTGQMTISVYLNLRNDTQPKACEPTCRPPRSRPRSQRP